MFEHKLYQISVITLSLLLGLMAPVTQADRATTYSYTPEGFLETVDGPRTDVADITTYGYDDYGNRNLIQNPLGHEVRTTAFDGASRPLTLVDPNGVTTQLTYDPRGRLISQAVSDGVTTRTTGYTYDPVGNLTQVTSPNNRVLHYHYDAGNRLIGLEDGAGNRIDFTLDAMGNRLETQVNDTTGTLRYHQQQVYNQLGRLKQVIDADNHNTNHSYDAKGNLTETTNARANTQQQTYDALDRLQDTTDTLNGITGYTYDDLGNLASVTDPTGLTTSYEYDVHGNLITLTSPDTGVTIYTYDAAGNRLTQTDARGVSVSYTYDALNRLTQISYPDVSLNVSYSYDEGNYGIGRLTGMSDAHGTTRYRYNAFGQLLSKVRTSHDGITTRFHYGYDQGGRLKTLTYPSGRRLSYGYDTLGQIASVTLHYPDGTQQVLAQKIQRLPFGPIRSLTYGNGLSLGRDYDQNYRLTGQTVADLLQSHYSHDPVGNIIQWQDLLNTGRDQGFGYDELDRLVSANGSYGNLAYGYDGVGNRLSFTEGAQTETYSYVPNTHRLQQILGDTTDNRRYDAAGNTLQSLIGTYTYDKTNRMVKFSKPGTQSSYAYNGQGERIRKTLNGTPTRYRYGENGQLLGEYDQSGSPLREYVYLGGQPLAMLDKDQATGAEVVYYLHTDHLGAVVKASDAGQSMVWDAERRPFGERVVSVGLVEMPLGFPGQYYDQETGNYYNYFRDYDPSTGRYLQSDPIGLNGGLNTYTYVLDNPLRFVDALGLCIGGGCHEVTLPLSPIHPIPIKFPPSGIAQSVISTQTVTQGIMDPAPTIGWPNKHRGKYTCTCRAQCRGDCLNPGENQQYGIATAVGQNLPQTKNEAKKAAESLISCQGKHTTCKCTGPKGEHIPEGG